MATGQVIFNSLRVILQEKIGIKILQGVAIFSILSEIEVLFFKRCKNFELKQNF